jgi:hypothetical protein
VSRRWARILLREWGSATVPVPGTDDPRGQGHLQKHNQAPAHPEAT